MRHTSRLMPIVLAAVFVLVLLAPSCSLAAFTRPLLRQITGTPTGLGGSEVPFGDPGGVSVDTAGDLWVADVTAPGKLDEFGSSGGFLASVELKENHTVPQSLAIESSTGHFYITGEGDREGRDPHVEVFDDTGTLLRRSGLFGSPAYVAVDNSTDPFDLSAGSVYVAHAQADADVEEGGDGLPPGIERLNASGEPLSFTGSAEYIKGNEIVGSPKGGFEDGLKNMTVDSNGNIYAVVRRFTTETVEEVDEFDPSGIFVRAFTGEDSPGLGESHEKGGFGGALQGIAVDPVSGHLLVSVSARGTEGAIDEFDATGHFINQITVGADFAPLGSLSEMTVGADGDLYVVEAESHTIEVYGPGHFLPGLELAEAGGLEPTSAVLKGSVNPEDLALTDCHFEYVSETAFEATGYSDLSSGGRVPCEPAVGSIPIDSSPHPVQANLTGLVSGTTYRYRLLATTEGSLGGTAQSESLAFTASHAPRVDATFATNVSSTFADLRARIDPLGVATSYHFEYDTSAYPNGAAHGVSVPVPDVGIGSGGATGSADASVIQQIGDLAAGATYHFRVVAENDVENRVEIVYGPDQTFSTLPEVIPGLPDDRAYELVTPPNKGSSPDLFSAPEQQVNSFDNKDVGYPSEEGDGFLLETQKATFGPFPGTGNNVYVFHRDAEGKKWTYTSLVSPSLGAQGVFAPVFDPSGFSRVGLDDAVGSLPSPAGSRLMNLVGSPGGPYTSLHADVATHSLFEQGEATEIVGASHDLSNVVLGSMNHTLAPGAESQDPGSDALYEWAGGYQSIDGELQPEFKLVNVNSEGALLNRCGALLGQTPALPGGSHNAVSHDGSKIIFTAPDPDAENDGPGCWNGTTGNAPQLYVRSGGETIQVSAPETGVADSTGHHPAAYVGAAEDGSKIFFVTETELTKDDAGIHDQELYEYDTETAELTRISAGEPGSRAREPGGSAYVATVPAISANGAAVYFTAFGQLTANAPAVSGEEVNLYRYDTTSGETVYVATVSVDDYPNNTPDWFSADVALATDANWYTTPDGRYLIFDSARELTGYSTTEGKEHGGLCPEMDHNGAPMGHCHEVYRYDSVSGDLNCVSCNPSGAPPLSNAFFGYSTGLASPAAGPVRAMSDDGSYVFFDTADALVPQDGNGTLDVYEWHEGHLALISSGQDPAPSYFLGADPGGANVFFGTHARLVRQDTDTAGDIYDARICTESDPCIQPSSSGTSQCEGDACQNPAPAPVDATPASLTFSGPGNPGSETGAAPVLARSKVKPLTRAQKLSDALKVCKKKSKKKRSTCERQARKKYAPVKKRDKR